MKSKIVTGMPDPIALAVNITAAMTIDFFRPILFVTGPATKAPTAAPIRARATDCPTQISFARSVISSPPANPESGSMNMSFSTGTAPLITAVSKPKRNPPSAATVTIPSVNPRWAPCVFSVKPNPFRMRDRPVDASTTQARDRPRPDPRGPPETSQPTFGEGYPNHRLGVRPGAVREAARTALVMSRSRRLPR